MICTYNPTLQIYLTEDGKHVQLPCYGLAICDGRLYTRTERPGHTRSYTLEPCTEWELQEIMSHKLGYSCAEEVFSGSWEEAVEWLRAEVSRNVSAHQEDLEIDLAIMGDLFKSGVYDVSYTIGLRKCGVDGPGFIRLRNSTEYSAVYMIVGDQSGDTTISTMTKED